MENAVTGLLISASQTSFFKAKWKNHWKKVHQQYRTVRLKKDSQCIKPHGKLGESLIFNVSSWLFRLLKIIMYSHNVTVVNLNQVFTGMDCQVSSPC